MSDDFPAVETAWTTDAEVRAVMKVCREFYSTPVAVGPQFARAVIDAARNAR